MARPQTIQFNSKIITSATAVKKRMQNTCMNKGEHRISAKILHALTKENVESGRQRLFSPSKISP